MSMSPETNKRILDFLNNVWKPDYMIWEDLADELADTLLEEGLDIVEKEIHVWVEGWWYGIEEDEENEEDGVLPADKYPLTTEARVQLEEYGIHIDGDVKRLLSILEKVELCETQNEKTLPQGVSLTQYSRVILDVCFRLTGN